MPGVRSQASTRSRREYAALRPYGGTWFQPSIAAPIRRVKTCEDESERRAHRKMAAKKTRRRRHCCGRRGRPHTRYRATATGFPIDRDEQELRPIIPSRSRRGGQTNFAFRRVAVVTPGEYAAAFAALRGRPATSPLSKWVSPPRDQTGTARPQQEKGRSTARFGVPNFSCRRRARRVDALRATRSREGRCGPGQKYA